MKITCNTANLNKAIQTAQRAINSKPSTPIFSGIHLIARDNQITIQGMDMNLAISCTIDADIQEEGEIVVSAKYFSELVRKLPGEETTITKDAESKSIKVKSAQADFKMLIMGEDDYPKFPTFEGNKVINIEDTIIKELIKKTIFACSTDEARPLFTGIYIEVANGKITFVGTNTHRLAIKSLPFEHDEELSMIIPSKVLNEISRNLTSEVPEMVKLTLLNNQLLVNIDNVIIVSRLIEGKFPDYKRVIPPKFAITTNVNVKALAGATERVSLFSTEGEYNIVKITVNADSMTVSSSSPELGTGREIIPCQTEGEELNVAFNSKYLLDILKNLESETVDIAMNTSLSPVCMTTTEEEGYTYIVTPVRVVF